MLFRIPFYAWLIVTASPNADPDAQPKPHSLLPRKAHVTSKNSNKPITTLPVNWIYSRTSRANRGPSKSNKIPSKRTNNRKNKNYDPCKLSPEQITLRNQSQIAYKNQYQNFRKYQNSNWKNNEPVFNIDNELIAMIENTDITPEYRDSEVKKILRRNIKDELNQDETEILFVNQWDGYAIRRASDYGYTNIVKMLLDYQANVDYLDCEALRLAAQNGHLEIVKLMYTKGCRIDSRQEYALRASSRLGHRQVVQYLLSLGADARTYDGFALACTVDPEIWRDLCQASRKEYGWNDDKEDAWHYATNYGKYGDTYCSEFDIENLPYASTHRIYFNFVLLFLGYYWF